jgi:Glycosyl transferase family 2
MTSWISHRLTRRMGLNPVIPSIPKPTPISGLNPSPSMQNIKTNNSFLPIPNNMINEIKRENIIEKQLELVKLLPLDNDINHIYKEDMNYSIEDYGSKLEEIEQFTNNHLDSLITFIIPSINRNTLYKTILSILNQTITKWKIIILFDGCLPSDPLLKGLLDNTRILMLCINKKGEESDEKSEHGRAGEVRNIGMQLVTTPWCGFVDDDDMIDTKYIENLLIELNETNNVDVVLFRMIDDFTIIPSIFCKELKEGEVGISFVLKTSLIREGYFFTQSRIEDFKLIKQLEQARKKIVISPFITYYVNYSEPISFRNLKRVLFN